ncbi:hypothetical protein ACFL5O_00940 [Myxococcota bacterium]
MGPMVVCRACGVGFPIAPDLFEDRKRGEGPRLYCQECGELISESDSESEPRESAEADVPKNLWLVSFARDDDRVLNLQQIVEAIRLGAITPATIAWREGLERWEPLQAFPEVADALTDVPPPAESRPRSALPQLLDAPPRLAVGEAPSSPTDDRVRVAVQPHAVRAEESGSRREQPSLPSRWAQTATDARSTAETQLRSVRAAEPGSQREHLSGPAPWVRGPTSSHAGAAAEADRHSLQAAQEVAHRGHSSRFAGAAQASVPADSSSPLEGQPFVVAALQARSSGYPPGAQALAPSESSPAAEPDVSGGPGRPLRGQAALSRPATATLQGQAAPRQEPADQRRASGPLFDPRELESLFDVELEPSALSPGTMVDQKRPPQRILRFPVAPRPPRPPPGARTSKSSGSEWRDLEESARTAPVAPSPSWVGQAAVAASPSSGEALPDLSPTTTSQIARPVTAAPRDPMATIPGSVADDIGMASIPGVSSPWLGLSRKLWIALGLPAIAVAAISLWLANKAPLESDSMAVAALSQSSGRTVAAPSAGVARFASAARGRPSSSTGSGLLSERSGKPTGQPARLARTALPGKFDKAAARSALEEAEKTASGCRQGTDPRGTAVVIVTFDLSGRASDSFVKGKPFAGTRTGACVAAVMRRVTVPAFGGRPVTVSKRVEVQ